MDVVRRWDIGTGRPVRVPHPQRPREVTVAAMQSPLDPPAEVQTWGKWACTVFGLDPRCKLVAVPFFRRASWAATLDGDGVTPLFADSAEGAGYSKATAKAVVVRRDSSGRVHDIGVLPDDVWLNAGVVPDGCELVTGADGIRIEIEFELDLAPDFNHAPSWDLVCALEVVPNERLGCSGLADEIAQSLEVRVDPPIVASWWMQEE